MNPYALSRRDLLKGMSSGFGYLAFAGLSSMAAAADATGSPLQPRAPHFPGRARHVIFLCMSGAPSHVDTFDYKPKLSADDGKRSDRPGRIPGAKLMGSPWKFRQHGQSGLWVSELFPAVATHVDELCVLRSVHTDLPAHPEAYLMLHTGSSQFIRPSLGAWTLYGLGTEGQDLPGFIAVKPTSRNGGARITAAPSYRRLARRLASATRRCPSPRPRSATSGTLVSTPQLSACSLTLFSR